MSIQKFSQIKRTIFILLVVGFLLSVTAGAVNAKSAKGTDVVAIKFVTKE